MVVCGNSQFFTLHVHFCGSETTTFDIAFYCMPKRHDSISALYPQSIKKHICELLNETAAFLKETRMGGI